MAYLEHRFCLNCNTHNQPFTMVQDIKKYACDVCEEKTIVNARVNHFKALDNLTVKQRIRKIEEWIYDFRPTYINPPRF